MPGLVESVTGSPWILAVVLVVAGLDAVLPFMPSESAVVAVAVASATTGRPNLALLILTAAAGAYAGDRLGYRIGRRGRARFDRCLSHRRAAAARLRVDRLLHRRGGLVIVFARYVPGGRSSTALAAGLVGYPARRFHWYTLLGVVLWSAQAALIGRAGGAAFAGRPLSGLLAGWGAALVVGGLAWLVPRLVAARRQRPAARYALPASVAVVASRYSPYSTESPTAGNENQA